MLRHCFLAPSGRASLASRPPHPPLQGSCLNHGNLPLWGKGQPPRPRPHPAPTEDMEPEFLWSRAQSGPWHPLSQRVGAPEAAHWHPHPKLTPPPRPQPRSPAAWQPRSSHRGNQRDRSLPSCPDHRRQHPPAPHHTPPSRPRPARQPAHERAAAAGCGERAVRTSGLSSPPRVTGSRLLGQTGVPVRSARASPWPAFRRPPALAASPSPQFAGREVAAAARRQR